MGVVPLLEEEEENLWRSYNQSGIRPNILALLSHIHVGYDLQPRLCSLDLHQ